MKVFTSYFAKQKQLEDDGLVCVGICAKVPIWFKGVNLESIAPSRSILNEYKSGGDASRFANRYKNEVLCILKTKEQCQYLLDDLSFISHGKDVALCCYESPDKFCHRHILADFLNNMADADIHEYEFNSDEELSSYALF